MFSYRRPRCWGLLRLGLISLLGWQSLAYAEGMDEGGTAASSSSEIRSWKSLADRIPSVTGRMFRKTSRIELSPLVGLGFNDPFYTKIPLGLHVLWHLHEDWAVGIVGEYSAAVGKRIPVFRLDDTASVPIDHLQFLAKGQVQWAPIYGKISWMAEGVSHFATYLAFSGGIAGRGANGFGYVIGAGVGQHYFLTTWLAIKAELRLDMYPLRRSANTTSERFQGQLSAIVAASFFLPDL